MSSQVSRTKRSVKNLLVGLAVHVFTVLLGFLSRSIFIHYLTVEYLGINGLFTNVLTVLSFAELGISGALVFAMYKPAKEQDEEKLCQLLGFYKTAYYWIAGFVSVIGFGLSFFLNYLVPDKPNIPENFQVIFWLFLLNNVLSYFLAYKQSVLTVNQKQYITAEMRLLSTTIQTIGQILVLVFTHNFYLYLLVRIICTVSNNVFLSVYVHRHYKWTRNNNYGKLPAEDRKSIFRDVKALSISKIAGVVSNGADNIIIAKLMGLAPVGIASNYTLVINSVNGVLWAGLSSITGCFGNFNVDASLDQRRKVYDEMYLCTTWIYTFVCVGLMVLLNPFITIWIGHEFLTNDLVAAALVLIIYISGINFPVYTFRTTCGYFDEVKIAYVMSGVLNVLFSIVLGKYWGLFGVYIATSLSRFCTSEISEGRILYSKILQLPLYRYFLRYAATLAMLVVNYLITRWTVGFFAGQGIHSFLIQGIVCVLVSNFILFVRYAWTAPFRRLLQRAAFLADHEAP